MKHRDKYTEIHNFNGTDRRQLNLINIYLSSSLSSCCFGFFDNLFVSLSLCLCGYFVFFLPHKHLNKLISMEEEWKKIRWTKKNLQMRDFRSTKELSTWKREKLKFSVNNHRILFWLQLIMNTSKAIFDIGDLLYFVLLLFDLRVDERKFSFKARVRKKVGK